MGNFLGAIMIQGIFFVVIIRDWKKVTFMGARKHLSHVIQSQLLNHNVLSFSQVMCKVLHGLNDSTG